MNPRPIWPVLAVSVSFLLAACNGASAPVTQAKPVVVEPPQPLQGPAGAEVFPGTVFARVEADLAFRIPGKIASRKVELGSRVKPGMVLAELDPEDAELNLAAAQATVSAAEADLWLAEEEERRYRDLKERGHIGQSALDQRVNASKLTRARLDQARSQLNLARNQSQYTELKADLKGVITQVVGEPGNVVTAGQPVLRVAADGEREIRISVPEGRVNALKNAAQLGVEIFSEPGKLYAGRIRDINPRADQVTRTHEARITVLDADEAVQLGATATVRVLTMADGKTFQLPATALDAADDDQARVWVIAQDEDGRAQAQPHPVQVLQYLDGSVIVTGDISLNDRLISAGVHQLVPGIAVRPIDRSAKPAL